MIRRLIDLPARSVHCVSGDGPAVFYVADEEGGGVLVNTPEFSPALLEALSRVAPLEYEPWLTAGSSAIKKGCWT